MSARPSTDARAISFAAVLVMLAGYAFVFRTGEQRIADQLLQNEHVAAAIIADQAILDARSRIEHERTLISGRVRSADLDADGTHAVASFLADAARTARRHRTSFAAISSIAPAVAPTPAASPDFSTIPLDVTLEGRYVNVLATMRELSTNRIPASVDVAALARKSADVADATLTATLRVTLERRALPEPHVRPRPS